MENMQLERWKRNYQKLRKPAWILSKILYHIEGYGPQNIEGPALLVFENHLFSSDPMLASYLENYISFVYHDAPLNLLTASVGRATGGISVDERKNGIRLDYKRLLFMLENKEVVGLFPYNDVNGHPEYGIIELAMWFEKKHGHIDYIPASVDYRQSFHGKLCWPKSQWPMWFITYAKVFIGTHVSSENQTLKSLVELLQNERRKLRDIYK